MAAAKRVANDLMPFWLEKLGNDLMSFFSKKERLDRLASNCTLRSQSKKLDTAFSICTVSSAHGRTNKHTDVIYKQAHDW